MISLSITDCFYLLNLRSVTFIFLCFFLVVFFKCYVSIIFFSPVYFYIFELTCATLMWKSKSLHLRRAKNLKAEYWLHLTLDGHVFFKSHNNISKILSLKRDAVKNYLLPSQSLRFLHLYRADMFQIVKQILILGKYNSRMRQHKIFKLIPKVHLLKIRGQVFSKSCECNKLRRMSPVIFKMMRKVNVVGGWRVALAASSIFKWFHLLKEKSYQNNLALCEKCISG